jgi:hypothetical protein
MLIGHVAVLLYFNWINISPVSRLIDIISSHMFVNFFTFCGILALH